MKIVTKDQPFSYQITEKTIILSEKVDQKNLDHTGVGRSAARYWCCARTGWAVTDGVNIIVKGTKKGHSLSSDGKFSIDAKEGDVLVFSSIGYGSKEIPVGAYNEIGIVQLALAESKLDEVQIIAYGTTTQRLNTGNGNYRLRLT